MAECDERSWLAALSLMNSGMEADDASNKTFVAVMCAINGDLGNLPAVDQVPGQFTEMLNSPAMLGTR
jgi:hypothetical protein